MTSSTNEVTHGLYRHFKGGQYYVLSTAKHTEAEEVLVVYFSVRSGEVFARPLTMWQEEVEWPDGTVKPRFVRDGGPPGVV